MYDFKHSIDNNHRYNIYKHYDNETSESDNYLTLKNRLILIILLLIVFMIGVFSLQFYQKYNSVNKTYIHKDIPITSQDEYTHLELTKAISRSIVQNLQSKQTLKNINDNELKHIIKSVVNKIENGPSKFIYTKN